MSNKITYTSELMKNFWQADIMSAQAKFQALQTDTGLSLFFSIGTDGVFYATEETQGKSTTGWKKEDLSSAQITKDYPNTSNVNCKLFDSAQNISTGTVGLAMVLTGAKNDALYLSLNNSNSDTKWLKTPSWTAYPFDAKDKPSSIDIVKVFISETENGQFIVVDIVKDPNSDSKLVSRYYIHIKANQKSPPVWQAYNIDIDLDANHYQSCLGRQGAHPVDGFYTIGSIDQVPQFTYQALYEYYRPGESGEIVRLQLPQNLQPDSIATARNTDDSTDLFCMANDGLYYFAADNQKDGTEGVLLFKNDLFTETSRLFAYKTASKVIVWGLNQANQVFYTSASTSSISTTTTWTHPIPILTNVDLISPYINCTDDGNTFFAVAGSELTKMVKSPTTSIWNRQQITLPPPNPTTKAKSFSSYTTRIQLTGADNQPIASTPLLLSSDSRGTFVINNLYYVLDSHPIPIETDQLGSITIIESVNDLAGSKIIVSEKGTNAITINPMENPINKVTSLDTVSKLKNAVITHPDGSTNPLVASGTAQKGLESVAQANSNLATAYGAVSTPSSPIAKMAIAISIPSVGSLENAIISDFGDLSSWLVSGVKHDIQILKDAAKDTWNFVVSIGGKIYAGVLDTVEKIAGAIQWIYNAIETAIEDLIKFLEFLFEWKSITRTKKVLKNLVNVFIHHEIDQIEVVKQELDGEIQKLIKVVDGWSDVKDWSGLGKAANSPLKSNSKPTGNLSTSSSLLSHHFSNNANNLSLKNSPTTPTGSPLDTLFSALKKEDVILSDRINELYTLAGKYTKMNLEEILGSLIGILANGTLESAQNVMDALLDVLCELATDAAKVLDTPIHIPVVSDILEFFGVSDLSLLDIIAWVVAVPSTIVYKIVFGHEPFPDNQETDFLINTSEYKTLVDAFSGQSSPSAQVLSAAVPSGGPVSMSTDASRNLLGLGHGAVGFLTVVYTIVSSFDALENESSGLTLASGIMVIFNTATLGVVDALVPKDPLKNKIGSWISKTASGMVILSKLVFIGAGFAQKKFPESEGIMEALKAADGRAIGAITNSILVLPALSSTIWHFIELAEQDDNEAKSIAIIDETANIASYIGRVSYTIAVNTDVDGTGEGAVKAIATGVLAVAYTVNAGLLFVEGFVDN